MAHSDLKRFLFRKPQPSKVRVTLEDGTEKTIAIASEKRGGWVECEQTILALDPISVEALNNDDTLLRAANLRDAPESDDKRKASSGGNDAPLDKVLQRYGEGLREAYTAGASAASASQDKLIVIVETLTAHLTSAIANMHHLGAQLGSAVAAGGEDSMQVMAMNLLTANAGGNNQQSPQQLASMFAQLNPQQKAMLAAAIGNNGNNAKPTNGG